MKTLFQNKGFLVAVIWAIAPSCFAAEIKEQLYHFDSDAVIFQDAPTFVVGNFPKKNPSLASKIAVRISATLPLPESSPTFAMAPEKKTVPTASVPMTKVETNIEEICFDHPVYFESGKIKLSPQEQTKFSLALIECHDQKTPLDVAGFTDQIGTLSQNKIVAKKRAEYIAIILKQYGFTLGKILGKAKTDFVTKDLHKQYLNRRVEIMKAVLADGEKK